MNIKRIILTTFILLMFKGSAFAHSPHDKIFALDLSPSYAKDNTLFIYVLGRLKKSTDGGYSWKELINGLDATPYTVSSISISPTFPLDNTVFVSSLESGIYQSVDGGTTWRKLKAKRLGQGVQLLAVSPNYHRSGILLVADMRGGLYKSVDHGEHFSKVLDGEHRINAVIIPDNERDNMIIAGDSEGVVYVSTDGSATWVRRIKITDSGITALSSYSSNGLDLTLVVGTAKNGVFKSVDNGMTFQNISNELPDKEIVSIAATSDKTTESIWVSTWYKGVFRSDDEGQTWKVYSKGLTKNRQADNPKFKSPHFAQLKISPNKPHVSTLFLSGFNGLFKSTDGGLNWFELETLPTEGIHRLALSTTANRDVAIALTTMMGGVNLSKDSGTTWQAKNLGLKHLHLWGIAFSPAFDRDQTILMNSNYDFYVSTDKGEHWKAYPLGYRGWRTKLRDALAKMGLPGRYVLTKKEREMLFPWNIVASPNFSNDHNLFFGTRYRGVWSSEDSGAHWTNIWEKAGWVDSLVISPAFISDGTLYAFVREEGIYKSVDRGKTWGLIHKADRGLTALAISPNYQKDGTVFASGTDGLIKTIDRGRTWQKISGFCCDGGADVAAIALSPNYANDGTVLVSVTGKGLYKSENGGTEFIETGANLIDGNHLLRTLAFSPNYAQDNMIVGASNESLFRSQDGGASWERLTRPIRYEENSDYVRYQGQWESAESEKSSARRVSYSGVAGDKVSLDFVGSGVHWIASKSDHHGIGKIYIDGLLKGNADLFSDSNEYNTMVFSIENLPDRHHSVTIEVADIKNPKSSGYRVDIDAFEVIH